MLTRIRDAITGQWTTKEDGDARPNETVEEMVENAAAGKELIEAAEAVVNARNVIGVPNAIDPEVDRLAAALQRPL